MLFYFLLSRKSSNFEKILNSFNYMSISINEFRVLRTLSDGEQHAKAPKGLTDAQFCIAVQLLKQKKLIHADFEEGGKVVSSQINMAGRAVLADLKELEKKILNHALYARNIRECDYKILLDLKNNGSNAFSKEIKDDSTFFERLSCLRRNKWIAVKFNYYSLSDKGFELLAAIEYEVNETLSKKNIQVPVFIEPDADIQDSFADSANQVEQKSKTQLDNTFDIRIKEGHLSDFIKVIKAMCDANYFVKKDGGKVNQVDVMDLMSEAFHSAQLKDGKYSSLLSKSTKAQKRTYLNTFEELEKKAENFYKVCLEKANNKD